MLLKMLVNECGKGILYLLPRSKDQIRWIMDFAYWFFPKSWKSKLGEVKSVFYLICFLLIDISARNGGKTSTTHTTGEVLHIQTHNHDRVRWPGNADPCIRRGIFSRCIDEKSVQETILGLRKIHTQAKAHYTHKATITKHPFTRHGKAGGFRTEFHLFQS